MDTLRLIVFIAFGFFQILSRPWEYIPLVTEFVYQRTLQRALLQPLDANKHYYKNILGTIYYNKTTCSLLICSEATEFQKVEGADPNTFQVIQEKYPEYPQYSNTLSLYGKDKNFVYYHASILPLADTKTFTLIRSFLGQDADRYYFLDQPLNEFFQKNFPTNNPITDDPLKAVSFKNSILVIEQRNVFFVLHLFDPYTPIRRITQAEANTYPPFIKP